MYYLIDGYNLIFSLKPTKESLRSLREKMIHFLQKECLRRKMSGTLVFDGAHRRDEESGLNYASPLVIAYAPKGQSADEYIVEILKTAKNPKQMTVVTNDKGLSRHAQSCNAKSLKNDEFLSRLAKRKKPASKTKCVESPQNLERLLKIFEDRLNFPPDET